MIADQVALDQARERVAAAHKALEAAEEASAPFPEIHRLQNDMYDAQEAHHVAHLAALYPKDTA